MADAPVKPRRRWIWVCGGVLLLLALLISTHALLTYRAERMLSQQIEEYRQAGEPILIDDFNPPPPPDEQNAAIELIAAAERIDIKSEEWIEFSNLNLDLPPEDERHSVVREILRRHQPTLELVDRAVRKPQVHWNVQFTSPATFLDVPVIVGQRPVAQLLDSAAHQAHERGDDAEALRRVQQTLFIARAVGEYPSLIGSLVAMGIDLLAVERLLEMAPSLSISAESSRSADPEQVRQLIEQLLEDDLRLALHRGLLGERMMQLHSGTLITSGGISISQLAAGKGPPRDPAILTTLARPVFLNDIRLMITHTTEMARAIDAPTWPAFQAQAPAHPADSPGYQTWRHVLSSILLPSLDRSAEQLYRTLTMRQLAAVTLAIRWYSQEHHGALPESLDQLVPRYLPAIPTDPQASGSPLRYNRERAIVYSVGTDGKDGGGSTTPSRQTAEPGRWDREDVIVALKSATPEVSEE